MTGWSKFLFWSTVLTLPTIFFIPKKKPAASSPPAEDEPIVSEPDAPPAPKES